MKLFLYIIMMLSFCFAQNNDPKDVESIDAIIKAYYEVVSRPAGQLPDRVRDKWIHHPNALVSLTRYVADDSSTVRTMTIDQYHDNQNAESGFFEWEINRQTQRFGNVAQVWSTYAWSTTKDGEVGGRGINSIQLFHDGKRWWVMSWLYDSERDSQHIPEDYLN